MKRTINYYRVSTDEQAKKYGLPSQAKECRAYAEAHGLKIVAEFEEDYTGTVPIDERPEGRKAFEMIGRGEADVLLAGRMDRLVRPPDEGDEWEIIDLIKSLAKIDVEIHIASKGRQGTTFIELLTAVIEAKIAGDARRSLLKVMMAGKRAKVESGNVSCARQPPYGYNAVKRGGVNTLEVNEDEAEVVRLIFRLYTGPERLSMYAIAQRLSEQRVPTWVDLRRPGKGKQQGYGQWCANSVRNILTNETYTGVWHFGKRRTGGPGQNVTNRPEHLISVEVPAIIDDVAWAVVQERREENKRNVTRSTKYPYLLRGLLRCTCGLRIQVQAASDTSGTRLYYRCPAVDRFKYSHRPCDLPRFRSEQVDAVVWDWLKSRFDPDTLSRGLIEYQAERERMNEPIQGRIDEIDAALRQHEAQLERLLDLYLTGEFSQDVLIKRKRDIDELTEGLQRERAGLVARLNTRVLTEQQVQTLHEFAARFAENVSQADEDFSMRRRAVEVLDLRGRLEMKDGEKVIHVWCILGDEVLRPETTIARGSSLTRTSGSNSLSPKPTRRLASWIWKR